MFFVLMTVQMLKHLQEVKNVFARKVIKHMKIINKKFNTTNRMIHCNMKIEWARH